MGSKEEDPKPPTTSPKDEEEKPTAASSKDEEEKAASTSPKEEEGKPPMTSPKEKASPKEKSRELPELKTKAEPPVQKRRSQITAKLAGISGNLLKQKKAPVTETASKAKFDENEFGLLPPPDYYYRTDATDVTLELNDEEEEDGTFHFTPVGRNAVEMGSRFYVERNLFSYLTNTTIPTEKNYYDDDAVDLSCYTQKPIAYIILGKPGVGRTTLAKQLATKLKAIYISPEEVVEHYKSQSIVGHSKISEVLESGGSIGDKIVCDLIKTRVSELDVLHRGYVMDGFPIINSEEISIEEQITVLEQLDVVPHFAFLINMQDADLYKRRIEQKYDPETSTIYGRAQYSKFNPDENVFPAFEHTQGNSVNSSASDIAKLKDVSVSDTGSIWGSARKEFVDNFADVDADDDPLDGSKDFLPLTHDVIFRLLFRTEDNPMFVNEDLEQFRNKLPALQAYVEKFDKRNVLELDAYWAPSVVFKRVYDFLQTCGVTHVPIPLQILRPLSRKYSASQGEFLGEDDDSEAPCPEENSEAIEIDWDAAIRAVSIRGLVDPRFRWRVSRWQNFCPVALKNGRSVIGKPELATAFLDKVFFMSSPDAVEKFIVNPRPFLLPKMPSSPIKFFILGHPLAGKSSFAKELAFITGSRVVDMNVEMEKRYGQVKHEFLYKKRLKYTLETKILVDKENHQEWKRQERARRGLMHTWVDDYIRGLAEAEIRAALDADRDRRRAERIEYRREADQHKMILPPYGIGCGGDDGWTKFCWKDFVKDVHGGKTSWTHQELLELAWDLFHQKRLYYKLPKREQRKSSGFGDEAEGEDDGELAENLGEMSEDASDNEMLGEDNMEEKVRRRSKIKRRRRRRCKKIHIKPENSLQPSEAEEEEQQSSDIDPNDNEVEESLRMRYPMIPPELVEIIPHPSPVPDHHPRVQEIVSRKLEEDDKYADTIPAELYVEVLRHATAEAQGYYNQAHPNCALTGGWVVENVITDIDKFRAILRTPDVCPDQVFVLTDRSDNRFEIYGRLKRIFRLQNAALRKSTTAEMMMRKLTREMGELPGEGGFFTGAPEDEDLQLDLDVDPDIPLDITEEKLENMFPLDDLIDPYDNDTPGNLLQLLIDANRDLTPAFDDKQDKDNWEEFLSPHEKYVLEQVRSKISQQGFDISHDSYSSDALHRHIASEFKSLNYEMSAFLKNDASTRASSRVWTGEDVKIIKEYLRHSRELGSLAYSKQSVAPAVDGMADNVDSTIIINAVESTPKPPTPDEQEEEEEEAGEGKEDMSTPDGLRSGTASTGFPQSCVDGAATEDEKDECINNQKQQAKQESPKRRFFMQIRLFDEFWNMAIPVCNEQGVKYWEIGLADQKNSRDKAFHHWNLLESRFTLKAKRVSENELREEQEEIQESLMKWGEPYEHNNPKGIPSKESMKKKRFRADDSEDESSEISDDEDLEEDRDLLTSFEGKPDQYNNLVKKMESQRCFGDMKFYCPVSLSELNLLRKGSAKFACKFRERLYYCADEESVQKFVENPMQYLSIGKPNAPPPPKICISGSPGCGQEEVALKLANEYNICYVNFRQRLHELMKARFGKDVGPNKTGKIVQRYDSEKLLADCKSADDLILKEEEYEGENDSKVDEDDEDSKADSKDSNGKPPIQLHPILSEKKSEELKIDETALKSLGILELSDLKTVPIGDIQRTERLTERRWKKLTKIESHVQAFLENGIQLPDSVLDEFIAPLWKEAPFNQVGFILIGFPNTQEDIEYLVKNKFIPEYVFLMECKQLVIRNRLLIDAVDRWHKEANPRGKKTTRLSLIHGIPSKAMLSLSRPTSQAKSALSVHKLQVAEFPYQTEGRPVIDEYEREAWTYSDRISGKITKALKHFHSIYSNNIRETKISLNKSGIDWLPIEANVNLFEAKRILTDRIVSRLKYRSSLFEDTIRLTMKEANALLNQGYFCVSQFQRWDPVELSNGNTAINLWNSSSTQKIPILYRRSIYFLAGEKNATHFEQNCWFLVSQDPPMNTVPAVVVVMGPPKSGKTTLAKRLANSLGLIYISGSEMIDGVIKHSFVSQFGDILHELEPTMLVGCPQPMLLAEEILNYIRNGQTVPKFMVYRILDMVLQQPKAQYHGVVFDDYPVTEEELQELLYRGVVPSTVIKLNVDFNEAMERCYRKRKPDYNFVDLPEEGIPAMEFSTLNYNEASETTQYWFKNEVQNTLEIDGTLNVEWIHQKSAETIKSNMKKMQNYLTNVILEKPSTLEGTCPLTSQIPLRLSPEFGFYCPVALNERDDLIRISDIHDLSVVVEYKGHVYLFASQNNAKRFLANPNKYIPPWCKRTPPKDVPATCILTPEEFLRLKCQWGFVDFDPVRYFDANHHFKGLVTGDPKHCVVYRNKLYCFINEENLKKFMKKPERYAHQLLPMKLPKKAEPLDMEKITWYCYLIAKGLLNEVRKVIQVAGEKRPRILFMNQDKCSALFMGYYFKSQNMNAPYEIRQKYRSAMFDIMQQKNNSKKFFSELQNYYGSRLKNLPDRLKVQLEETLKMEGMTDEEKSIVPTIEPDYSVLDFVEDYDEIRKRYETVKLLLHEVELKENNMEPFSFSEQQADADRIALEEKIHAVAVVRVTTPHHIKKNSTSH